MAQTSGNTGIIPFDPKKLAVSLQRVAKESQPTAGFIRMDKTGTWVYGADQTEVPSDAEFAVNPSGFQHGFVCWEEDGDRKLGEVVAAITDPLPDPGPLPQGGRGWDAQLGCHLKGVDGEFKGIEMVYRSTAVGGKRAVGGLAKQVGLKLEDGDKNIVPIVTLSSESYKHPKYGKIFTPIIKIARWIPMPRSEDELKAKGKRR